MNTEVIIRDHDKMPMAFEVHLSTLHGNMVSGFGSRERLLATQSHRMPRRDGYTWPMEFADAELKRRGFQRSGPWHVISGNHHADVVGVRVT